MVFVVIVRYPRVYMYIYIYIYIYIKLARASSKGCLVFILIIIQTDVYQ